MGGSLPTMVYSLRKGSDCGKKEPGEMYTTTVWGSIKRGLGGVRNPVVGPNKGTKKRLRTYKKKKKKSKGGGIG